MPKKKRIFTEILYTYVKRVNRTWLAGHTKTKKLSHSAYVDSLIEKDRKRIEKVTSKSA